MTVPMATRHGISTPTGAPGFITSPGVRELAKGVRIQPVLVGLVQPLPAVTTGLPRNA